MKNIVKRVSVFCVALIVGTFASCSEKTEDMNVMLGLAALVGQTNEKIYTFSGTVNGVIGTSITLQNNSADNLEISGDEVGTKQTFEFNSTDSAYEITVYDAGGRTCTVTNGSGDIGGDVTDIKVDCILTFATAQPAGSKISGFGCMYGQVTIAGDYLIVPDECNPHTLVFDSTLKSGTIADAVYSDQSSSSVDSSVAFSLNNDAGGFGISAYSTPNVYIWNSSWTGDINSTVSFTGEAADLVLFSNESGGLSATQMGGNDGGAYSNGTVLVVTDTTNNRVLIWNTIPTSQDTKPDLVLGQVDFTTNDSCNTVNDSTMCYPVGVWSDGKRIVVADSGCSRVLIWNSWPTGNGQAADQVLGQADFTSCIYDRGGTVSAASLAACRTPHSFEIRIV